MATFTWTATTAGGSNDWATAAAWSPTHAASFSTAPGDDFLIDTSNSNLFTITNIGAGGTAAPDIANSISLVDFRAKLLLADTQGSPAGALNVSTVLSLNGLLNLGTASVNATGPLFDGAVLTMGSTGGGGGTISFGANGLLEGALGDSVKNAGATPTMVTGSGKILAEGGIFQIGTGVQVASTGATGMQFQINTNATLGFADAVGGGTVVFGNGASSGFGTLEVADLSTFNPTGVRGLFVASGKDNETWVVDFLNVGTTASATFTNITAAGAILTVSGNSGDHAIPVLGNYTTKNANVNYFSDGFGGIDVFLTDTPCYAAGTAILTPDGEVPVETIQPGDMVMTSQGDRLVARKVIWAGRREIDLIHHPKRASVAPIRFHRHALGADQPRRDLLLSPDHCLFIDGGLVPARLLINAMTIVRDLELDAVSYHHLELDQHALLVAEGVAAESYLDTGNRAYFSNAGLAMIEHPEFAINEHLGCWETDACAPLLTRPEAVKPIWERFATRAVALGFTPPVCPTTDDPDLTLMVDGRTVRPIAVDPEAMTFSVPAAARSVRLRSRAAAPCERLPWLDDPRILGVAVRSFRLRDRSGDTVLPADHPALTDGWHTAEHAPDGAPWRWSDGDAVLPIASDGPCLLTINLSGLGTWHDDGAGLAT